ncbi:MAG: hypothetical protein A3F18_04465 [Legionellales bacterium RIFCSPHIGHO2_12_FULL_37_14]|nr:MAG: hypothetical protein A3F18_04465 [Legionellales bacterium RIFCSPHIGHO2_12_FULL_37_14]
MTSVALKKWGNSVGVRIPCTFLKEVHLAPGDVLEVSINEQGSLLLTPTKNKQHDWLEQFNKIADSMNAEETINLSNQFDEEDWTW